MREILKGISRRDFIKHSASMAALLGLSELYVPQIAAALENAAKKPAVLWLNGSGCTGCTVSLINSEHPTPAEIVLGILSIRYMETVMAASGHVAEKQFEDTVHEGGYVFVMEGAIPTAENGAYCMIGGKSVMEIAKEAAANSVYNVAVGSCACYGGIPAGDPNPTGCKGLKDVVGGTVVNIPGCPAHPDWMVGTITHILLFGEVPELDEHGRPKMFFGKVIHENCQRRTGYELGHWVKNFGEEETEMDYCMGGKGCRGPVTHADCPSRLWNSGTNYCIAASAPCAGCVEPDFPDFKDADGKIISLYAPIPEVAKYKEALEAEVEHKEGMGAGTAAALGAVVGAAAGVAGGYAISGKTKSEEKEGEK